MKERRRGASPGGDGCSDQRVSFRVLVFFCKVSQSGAAVARLLDERLGDRHLLEVGHEDHHLLVIAEVVRVADEQREEDPDHAQKVLHELSLIIGERRQPAKASRASDRV